MLLNKSFKHTHPVGEFQASGEGNVAKYEFHADSPCRRMLLNKSFTQTHPVGELLLLSKIFTQTHAVGEFQSSGEGNVAK